MSLDEKSVRSQVDFCVKAGSHGIVVPVNASEFIVLSDEERKDIIRFTVEQAAGRVPVIAGGNYSVNVSVSRICCVCRKDRSRWFNCYASLWG